jgi:hypothetical protein
MQPPAPTETELAELLKEIERYLSVVDAFRSEGAEPTWTEESETLVYCGFA